MRITKYLALGILALSLATAKASTIVGYLLDPNFATNTVQVTFKLSNPTVYSTTNLIYTVAKTVTATNGYFSVALGPGNYVAQIGPQNNLLTFAVPSDNNTYNLATLVASGTTYTYPYSPTYLTKTGDNMQGNLGFSGTTFGGLLLNVLTTTQRLALSGVNGMVVYDSTIGSAFLFANGSWYAHGGHTFASDIVYFPYFGSAQGDGTQGGFGTLNSPAFILGGDPLLQTYSHKNDDNTVWIADCNPYNSGPAMSLYVSTLNSNAWVGRTWSVGNPTFPTGSVGTNSNGEVWGWDGNIYPSYVCTSMQGPIGDKPGVDQLVNNGEPISISANMAVGNGIPAAGVHIMIVTNFALIGLGANQEIISNISFISATGTIYSNLVNGVMVSNSVGTPDFTQGNIPAIQGNYSPVYIDKTGGGCLTYQEYFQAGIFYPTSPGAKHISVTDHQANTYTNWANSYFKGTNINFGGTNSSVTVGQNPRPLTSTYDNGQTTFIASTNLDPNQQVQATNFITSAQVSGKGYLFPGGSGIAWDSGQVGAYYDSSHEVFNWNSFGLRVQLGGLSSAFNSHLDIGANNNTSFGNLWLNGNVNLNTDSGSSSINFGAGPAIKSGTGSPNSAVTAPIGSLYLRSDGGTSTTLYVKETGAGNTGWVAK